MSEGYASRRSLRVALIIALPLLLLPFAIGSGTLVVDTRNFDNYQQGNFNNIFSNFTQGFISPFIRFPKPYASQPNMTLRSTNASGTIFAPPGLPGIGIGIGFQTLNMISLINNTWQVPLIVTSGFTAPTWVVPAVLTEVFGNTQDRQTTVLSPPSATIIRITLGVNVITALPLGDNGKLWYQFSTNAGSTWQDFSGSSCSVNGFLLTTIGVKTTILQIQQGIANTFTESTMLRAVGCSGNGVGTVALGGGWITFNEQIPQTTLTINWVQNMTPHIEAVNVSSIGFNINFYYGISLITENTYTAAPLAEVTINFQWTAWLISRTCTTGCT